MSSLFCCDRRLLSLLCVGWCSCSTTPSSSELEETEDDVSEVPEGSGIECSGPVGARVYRLSATQYATAVQELLGLTEAFTITGDTEASGSFFPTDMAPVQAGLAAGYSQAVTEALDTLDVQALTGCDADAECARVFLQDFAERAFRRSLDEADVEALLDGPDSPWVVGSELDVGGGVRLALEAVLQAPSFIYRREFARTDDGQLDDFETATQLGFVLRNSLPDQALWEAAQAGELNTREQILEQVERLLGQRSVQQNLTRVVGGWFAVDRVLAASKDFSTFPGFNSGNLQQALFQSVNLFLEEVMWSSNGRLSTMLTSPTVFLNAALARAYGTPFDGDDPTQFIAMDFPDERAGILTQPAILAGNAGSIETNIVRRGLFMVNNALCLPAPPPPPSDPGVANQIAAQVADESQTERDKADFRGRTQPCQTCHTLFDPYGSALENYDAIGRFRRVDADGNAVNASVVVPETVVLPRAEFDDDEDATHELQDALELVQGLAQTDQLAVCGARQLLSYTLGRQVAAGCDAQNVVGSLSLDMTVADIFRGLMVSDLVRVRVAPGEAP